MNALTLCLIDTIILNQFPRWFTRLEPPVCCFMAGGGSACGAGIVADFAHRYCSGYGSDDSGECPCRGGGGGGGSKKVVGSGAGAVIGTGVGRRSGGRVGKGRFVSTAASCCSRRVVMTKKSEERKSVYDLLCVNQPPRRLVWLSHTRGGGTHFHSPV